MLLPDVPMLPVVVLQWSEIMVTELTWKLLPLLAVLPVEAVELLLVVLELLVVVLLPA
ncbi:MAG TPA: hypothetical protein VFJ47_00410 [Terriglobales bacterium]|nr:hypothetical protein [Terriglobales bacterium]